MLFSDALEVAIGLTFVFLLLSLAMTVLLEVIESFTRARGARLLEALEELLDDPQRQGSGSEAAGAIYSHPAVQGLFRGSFPSALKEKRLPSYIPTRNFALALIGQVLAGRVNAAPGDVSIPAAAHAPLGDRLRLAAERVDNEQLRRALLQAVDIGGDDFERIAAHLGNWYDGAMDRVSGRYKRRAQHLLFGIGLGAAVLLNINAFSMVESLAKNATLRRAVVAQAEAQARAGVPQAEADFSAWIQKFDALGVPVGWSGGSLQALALPTRASPVFGWFQIVVGYLLTALAVTLGSPFWFDVLNRLMVIRATVKPTEKSPEEGSEDRQDRKGRRVTVVNEAARPAAAPGAAAVATAMAVANRPIDTGIYAALPGADEKPFEEWD